jgi:hypothetical protein
METRIGWNRMKNDERLDSMAVTVSNRSMDINLGTIGMEIRYVSV